MAKISLFTSPNRPSSVEGAGPARSFSGDMLRVAAEPVLDLTKQKYAEQVAIQDEYNKAMEQKQKIVDNLESGARTVHFEEESFDLIEELKTEFSDDPSKAIEAYRKRSSEIVEDLVKTSPTTASALDLSQSLPSKVSQGLDSLHAWVTKKQTENAKGNMTKIFNNAANQASEMFSAVTLQTYVQGVEKDLLPQAVAVYGGNADNEIQSVMSDAVKGYGLKQAKDNPLQLLTELGHDVFSTYLKPNDIAELRNLAERGYRGSQNTREIKDAMTAFQEGEELSNLVGADTFVQASYAKLRSLEEQKKSIIVTPGIKSEDKKRLTDNLDRRIAHVKTLQKINYEQTDVDAVDDPTVLRELMSKQNEIFGPKAPRSAKQNLQVLLDQQDRLVRARDSKKISYGKYQTFYDDISFAFKNAVEKESKNTSTFFFWHDARQTGNGELKRIFKSDKGSKMDENTKAAVYVRYLEYLTAAGRNGSTITPEQAKALAIKAFSYETGIIMGAGK